MRRRPCIASARLARITCMAASMAAAPLAAQAADGDPSVTTANTGANTGESTAAESPDPAAPAERKRPRVRAIELQGLGMTQLLPRSGGGGEAAFVFGHPNFQVRAGMLMVGVPAFRLGEGSIGNALGAAVLDVCAAKQVLTHQIRMCVGGQAGGMLHVWRGYEQPGTRATPWGAGTMRGDYQLQLTRHFGVIGGVGVVIPVLGPSFRPRDSHGGRTPMVFPGPMAGFLSLGTTFRW